MIPGIILFFGVAITDWLAVARGWKRVEYFTKPLAMVVLLGLLVFVGGFRSMPLICFAMGIFLSLAGDVFLMLSNRWFIAGLAAFMLAHVAYIVGLNMPLPEVSPLWSLGLALLLALTAARILRQIIAGVLQKGLRRLALPVLIYGMVITVMLLSALLTLYRSDWQTGPAGLVSLGAGLFYLSDVLLAWNKFVTPIKNGRLANMVAYHLGQVALVIGILLQFAK